MKVKRANYSEYENKIDAKNEKTYKNFTQNLWQPITILHIRAQLLLKATY